MIGDRRVPLVPNIGIVLGSESALVVDTGMDPRMARKTSKSRSGLPAMAADPDADAFPPGCCAMGRRRSRADRISPTVAAQRDELNAKGRPISATASSAGRGRRAQRTELVQPDEVYEGDRMEIDLGGRRACSAPMAWRIPGVTR